MGRIGVPELLVVLVICGVFWTLVVLPFWKIFSKAGYSAWWSLSQIVPILNVVVLFYLAFAEWPVRRELEALKSRQPAR